MYDVDKPDSFREFLLAEYNTRKVNACDPFIGIILNPVRLF